MVAHLLVKGAAATECWIRAPWLIRNIGKALTGDGKRQRIMRKEIIGNCELYLGDCRDILPMIGPIDAVVTDPPYGLGERLAGGTWGAKYGGGLAWDQKTPDFLADIIKLAPICIIWGGNYFSLPPSRCWLIWQKPDAVRTMADAELAWTNLDANTRFLCHSIAATNAERVDHPTQKPIRVMDWSRSFAPTARTILDPFMGSGSTGVACIKSGRRFIGIEVEQKYFDIAVTRIEAAQRQGDMLHQLAEVSA